MPLQFLGMLKKKRFHRFYSTVFFVCFVYLFTRTNMGKWCTLQTKSAAPIFISVTISAMKALNVICIPSPGPSRNYSERKQFVTNTWKPCLLWSWESHKPQTNPGTSVALSLLYCRAFVCALLSGLFKAAFILTTKKQIHCSQLWCNQLNFLSLFISFFLFF